MLFEGNLEESGRLPDDASPCNGSSDDGMFPLADSRICLMICFVGLFE